MTTKDKLVDGQIVKAKRRRGIYLLPNLFTTAALFAGYYAIVAAMQDRFEAAAIAIFIAMILDGLDGRVARMTNTQSDFGAQYDSLSDLASFGIAPSLVMYQWALSDLGKLGWLAAFVYTASAALRLARFNTQVGTADKNYFQGLASPAAAAIIAGLVWVGNDYIEPGRAMNVASLILTAGVGLLMVSNFRYHSFKGIDLRGKVPFITMLVFVLVIVLVTYDPPIVLFTVFFGYALSGPILTLVELRKRRAQRKKARKLSAQAAEEGTNQDDAS
ncbi:CDP-diacylglycerol--serine O-phosphatidyltransferase [hydrothermal vent metagenome]|uniref:CDP-diacylglycerol--serine O-phosphatidyltransferase n=1 Tax=hydrothermal vent metagenome TaxID=652676 RepID=A0A3B0ZSB5_9ZZZZ